MKAVVLTENSNFEPKRDLNDIFSKRQPLQTIHGLPKPLPNPILIKNLGAGEPSKEITEKSVEQPETASRIPLIQESFVNSVISESKPIVPRERPIPPTRPQIRPAPVEVTIVPEPVPVPTSKPQTAISWEKPESGGDSQSLQPSSDDEERVPLYKYPSYYNYHTSKNNICSDEYNYYAVVNKCDHFIECKVSN